MSYFLNAKTGKLKHGFDPERPRTEAIIMDEILETYCSLSPENLFCDGERPVREARRIEKQLEAKLKKLFKEIGHEVGESEAYAYEDNLREKKNS